MKLLFSTFVSIIAVSATASETDSFETIADRVAHEQSVASIQQKEGYSIGYDFASTLKSTIDKQSSASGVVFDYSSVLLGLTDALTGSESRLNDQERKKVLTQLDFKINKGIQSRKEELRLANCAIGMETQTRAKAVPKAVVLDDGVILRPVIESSDVKAEFSLKPNDIVVLNYRASYAGGGVFDDTNGRKPMRLKVKSLIPGLQIAVSKMQVGGKYEVVVPPKVGFQDSKEGLIPPCSTLLFTVDLLDVVYAKSVVNDSPIEPILLN